ncbi:MAG: diphosphomevalonate decarboxylase [Chloroflexi bacterium]|nr:MAG: diphosphomevalonate decarboxylase [Chloroflexota bacterium]
MKKSTYRASTDVALIKYWGKRDEKLRLPENNSISMILDGLETVTTVEFRNDLAQDRVRIAGEARAVEAQRVTRQLDRIREIAGVAWYAQVESVNSFPKGTGLSSSGSGFAALTCAAADALDLNLTERELSILARQASGTACRCVCGGFVEWHAGDSSGTSYAETIFPADHWAIHDVVAVVDEGMKRVSSTEGHQTAQSSPFYTTRQAHIGDKIATMKRAIAARDFTSFGELVEAEALEFHTILLTSQPPLIAWYPGTVEVMLAVQQMRQDNIEAYFTINTGFNVHVLTLPHYVAAVAERLQKLSLVQKTLQASIGGKPQKTDAHLF